MRISKFPPSRYCGCVTAPVKFSGLCYVCFLHSFVCLLACFLKVPNFLIKDARRFVGVETSQFFLGKVDQ